MKYTIEISNAERLYLLRLIKADDNYHANHKIKRGSQALSTVFNIETTLKLAKPNHG